MSNARGTAESLTEARNETFARVALRRFERRNAQAAMMSAERIVESIIGVSHMAFRATATLLAAAAAIAELTMGAAERVADVLIGWVDVTMQRHGKHG